MASEAFETEKIDHKGWLYHPVYPNHWNQCSLYSMARWVNGLAFRDIQFSSSGMPVIKIAEIKGGISTQTKFTEATFDESVRVRPGDLLFSWSGQPETSIDAFWWRGPEGWLNQHVFRVTPAEGLDNTFFYYLLRYLKPNFVGIARNKQTTGLGHVTKRDLESMKGGYPSDSEQRAIAHILGTLDDKIELNRKQNETLEAMARALFKAWFVDFEPVRAKLEGRWQRGQSLPGLPAHLYDPFPERLAESELGEIPEGWEMQPLSKLLTIIGGGTPKTSIEDYWGGEIPWFSVVDTPPASNVFVVATEKNITAQGLAGSSARLIPKGTTIISARGTVGNLAIAGCDMTFNQSCYGLRGTGGGGDYFVYLTSQQMVDQLKSMAHGSVFSTITRQTFEAIQRPVPPPGVLTAFEGLVRGWFDAILSSVVESRTLAQLRDTLLPKLISGELRVQDAERVFEEASA